MPYGDAQYELHEDDRMRSTPSLQRDGRESIRSASPLIPEDDENDEIMSQSASDNMFERGYKVRFLQAFADEQIVNLGQTPKPPEITDQDDLRDASEDEPSGHGSVRACPSPPPSSPA